MKTADFLRQHIIDFLIGASVIIYILYGLLTVDETGKSIQQIIQDGAIAFVFSYSLSQLFMQNGLNAGDRNDKVIATNQLHGSVMEKVTPYIEGLSKYCQDENKEEIKIRQVGILASAGLVYDKFINGEYEYNTLSKPQKRAFNKATKVKVLPLSVTSLTTKEEATQNTSMPSKSKYRVKTSIIGLVQKILISLAVGYYAIKIVENPNWSYIIWTAIQACTFLIFGAMSYFSAYQFVVDNLREGTIKKINYLEKYYNVREKYTAKEQNNGTRQISDETGQSIRKVQTQNYPIVNR